MEPEPKTKNMRSNSWWFILPQLACAFVSLLDEVLSGGKCHLETVAQNPQRDEEAGDQKPQPNGSDTPTLRPPQSPKRHHLLVVEMENEATGPKRCAIVWQ